MRSKSPKVQGLQGPGVPGSQGPRYLKLTFKHELDSKEGPSCLVVVVKLVSRLKRAKHYTFKK